ncbi:MAG: DNA internalization-related competence protein ComEC/Rec2 [Deltaproteobacteria bacterium]|nr:DNA internalization-related competence protein ComEC/Rec2 [Deltaproteobacteria bacterium]
MDRQSHAFSLFRSSQPLVPVTLFFILGIVAGSYQFLNNELAFPLLLVALLLSALGIAQKRRFNLLLICAMFFLLGAILAGQAMNPNLPNHHIKKVAEEKQLIRSGKDAPGFGIEGVLANASERFPDKTRLYVDAEKVFIPSPIKDFGDKVTGKILITVGSPSVKVKYGDRIRFIAKLRMPRNFGNPGEFDHAGNLAREGIYVTGHVESERWIAVLASEQKWGLKIAIEQIRDRIREFIDNSGVKNAAVIKALILGEKGEISKNIKDSFSATGTAHILAISGLHIGIIAFVSYWIILKILKQSERFMLAFDIRKIAAASSVTSLLLYGAIAGFSVSTQRAVIMVLVFILSVIIDRERNLYNTLAAAAFVILIISPLAIYDISFQLSFISVLAIIYLAQRFQSLWRNHKEPELIENRLLNIIKSYLLNPLAVSIAASLGTAPFIAWHFHRVSIIGILANIIAVPLMGFIAVPLGLVSGLISFLSQPFAYIILKCADIALDISIWIVGLFAQLPYSSAFTTTPTILEVILFYLVIICIAEFNRAKIFRYSLPLVLLIFIGDYSFWYCRLNYNPNLTVTFISVGQGDSALVEFPYGKRMLIDGGGFYSHDFDVGERIIAPFLWKNKINKIDYIILSHPQADHMKGLKFIIERFHVKEFRWNGEISSDKAYKELVSVMDRNIIQRFIANTFTPALDINGVNIKFLNPPPDSHLDTNNNSLIARLAYKDVSFLFAGDVEDVGETAMLKRGEKIEATVLKVPHHGSRTSSSIDFLNKVNPKLAVASVGYLNPFSFPHPEIVKRYNDFKILFLRTDRDGAVTVKTNGLDIKVNTARQ